jgi:hypothetical protein
MLLLLFAAPVVEAQGPGGAPPPAAVMPGFRWLRHDGRTVTNADLPPGKLALIVFFDPDCEHCKRTLGRMDRESADYRSVSVYFVSMESQEKIDKFVAAYAPRLAARRNVLFLRDPGAAYMAAFYPVRFPSLFLYSPEHKLLDYEDNEETVFRIKRSMAAFGAARR